MQKGTKTTRISTWLHKLFTDKAEKEETSLMRKLDEVAESLHLIDVDEVILDDFLQRVYKEDESNTPRIVYETMSALLHYWDALNCKRFNGYSFAQFIDRWNIVAYYISSHIYTNVLEKSSLRDDELKRRAESSVALTFLFDKDVKNVLNCIHEIMKDIDPYENAYYTKKSKALILRKIFEHKKLMEYLKSELMVRKEEYLFKLFKHISKYELKTDGKSAFGCTINSFGIINKIAYMIYLSYKGELNELPYFVDEIFLSDVFSLYHTYSSNYSSSDLFDARALESAFRIAYEVKQLNDYTSNDSYLKGNLENGNSFNELDDALLADIESLKIRNYTYHAEMRMRTPMHIISETTQSTSRFILRPAIKDVILKHLINLCYSLYFNIVKIEGEILHFRKDSMSLNVYSEDKNAQIAIAMKKDFYYINLILYISSKNSKGIDATFTIDLKHDSLGKLYDCINKDECNTTKIEENLTFYYDNKDMIKLTYKQGSIFLHGKIRESFIDVLTKYVTSEEYLVRKKFNCLNHGLM